MNLLQSSLLLALALSCGGCQTTRTADAGSAIPSRIDGTLSPGDVLRVTFSGAPELTQSQRIRADGKITLPKVGEVQAAGREPLAIQKQLTDLYAPSLQNAEITVLVENSTFPVIVLGAVNRPGEVNLDRPSLLHAIGRAGGIVRGLADWSRVRIIHEGESGSKVRVVNMEAVVRGKSNKVINLQRGDTVIVPEKWL
jgi:polysaccharide export outer membrane protein